MTLTHGNDPEVLESIGDALRAEADRAQSISNQGAGGLAVLVEGWAGGDLDVFDANWRGAQQQLESAAQLLRAVGDRAREQAAQQRTASEGEGGGGAGTPWLPGPNADRSLPTPGGPTVGDRSLPSPDVPGSAVPVTHDLPVTGGGPTTYDLPEGFDENGPPIFRDEDSTSIVPQSVGWYEKEQEFVYTYYDEDDDTRGFIRFVDKDGNETGFAPLEGQDHYGGVYVDGPITYVSGDDHTYVYSTEDLRDPEWAPKTVTTPGEGDIVLEDGEVIDMPGGDEFEMGWDEPVPPTPIAKVPTEAHSSVTMHDGDLYVTQFTTGKNDPGNMYQYKLDDKGVPVGDPIAKFQVPPQTQGVSFDEAGNAYYSSSHGRGNESTLTRVSAEDFARDGGWTPDNGTSQTIPNMAEGSVIVDGKLYQVYESGANKYDDYGGPVGDSFVDRFAPGHGTDPRYRMTVHDLRQ